MRRVSAYVVERDVDDSRGLTVTCLWCPGYVPASWHVCDFGFAFSPRVTAMLLAHWQSHGLPGYPVAQWPLPGYLGPLRPNPLEG